MVQSQTPEILQALLKGVKECDVTSRFHLSSHSARASNLVGCNGKMGHENTQSLGDDLNSSPP